MNTSIGRITGFAAVVLATTLAGSCGDDTEQGSAQE